MEPGYAGWPQRDTQSDDAERADRIRTYEIENRNTLARTAMKHKAEFVQTIDNRLRRSKVPSSFETGEDIFHTVLLSIVERFHDGVEGFMDAPLPYVQAAMHYATLQAVKKYDRIRTEPGAEMDNIPEEAFEKMPDLEHADPHSIDDHLSGRALYEYIFYGLPMGGQRFDRPRGMSMESFDRSLETVRLSVSGMNYLEIAEKLQQDGLMPQADLNDPKTRKNVLLILRVAQYRFFETIRKSLGIEIEPGLRKGRSSERPETDL